jgi:hypothetical protein
VLRNGKDDQGDGRRGSDQHAPVEHPTQLAQLLGQLVKQLKKFGHLLLPRARARGRLLRRVVTKSDAWLITVALELWCQNLRYGHPETYKRALELSEMFEKAWRGK